MHRSVFALIGVLLACSPAWAQNSLYLEELTWTEVRDGLKAGKTSVIVPTGGTEQSGPHVVLGKENFAVHFNAGEIARRLGNAYVAPTLAYVPEGNLNPPSGHMRYPGSITLPEEDFIKALVWTGRSLKAGGFKNIILIGNSGGNQDGCQKAAEQLNKEWSGSGVRALFVPDYYTAISSGQKPLGPFDAWVRAQGEKDEDVGSHAGIKDTSTLMAVEEKYFTKGALIRWDKMVNKGGFEDSGVTGNPTRASVAYGKVGVEMQIDRAVKQIEQLTGRKAAPGPAFTFTAPAIAPASSVYLEELTWTEVRDGLKAGKTTVIIPTGGTEQKGPHMAMGKDNFAAHFTAGDVAKRLGNAYVAPVLSYVPEGGFEAPNADVVRYSGTISLPQEDFVKVLVWAGRGFKATGFKTIVFVSENGGNNNGLQAATDQLNKEFAGSDTRALHATDYYTAISSNQKPLGPFDAYVRQKGETDASVGSHAGIKDTSTGMAVEAAHLKKGTIIRWDKRVDKGGFEGSGVVGDPTHASVEYGKVGVEMQVERGVKQIQAFIATGR